MDGGTRDVRDKAPHPVPARPGRRGWWARLDRPSRRGLALCGAVAALCAVLFWPVEWWLGEYTGIALAFAVFWLAAPLGGGLLLGWPWVRVYGLFHAGASAALLAAEGATRWDAWAGMSGLVVVVAAVGAVLRPGLVMLVGAVRRPRGGDRGPTAADSGFADAP
jgi:hypothetical protein